MKNRNGFLNNHLLIAMPSMADERFKRAIIYICAHGDEGAVGLVLNKKLETTFPDLLIRLGIINEERKPFLSDRAKTLPVLNGGPVERNRGFVLHTNDYFCRATMTIASGLCLTSTTDVLKAISGDNGPKMSLTTLGYSDWTKGQLEAEVSNNVWLTSSVDSNFLFSGEIEKQYDLSLLRMGINPNFLVAEAGHA
ncbi:YqgE/AlgH family protein [Bartonella tamiae]|nr:YqgE/AlgH family protein [Bartonella tamiae]